jgi:hypothetical protein
VLFVVDSDACRRIVQSEATENQLLTYGYAQYDEGEPRTYGVQLRYQF